MDLLLRYFGKAQVTEGFLLSRYYILVILLNGGHPCRHHVSNIVELVRLIFKPCIKISNTANPFFSVVANPNSGMINGLVKAKGNQPCQAYFL